MTDAQNYPTPNDPGVLPTNLPQPPPYPQGEAQVDPALPYMPPPYSAAPMLYPPPPGGDFGPLPPGEVYPPKADGSAQEGHPEGNFVPAADSDVLLVSSFDDKTIRRAFIRKVFSIVTVQLLFTFSVVCVFTFSTVVRGVVRENLWLYLSAYIIFAVVAICLSCCSSFSRTHPWNLVALSVITVSLSYLVGTVASFHETTAVVIAMGTTLVISFSIIIFSAQTRVDFTVCNGAMLVLAMTLLMFGFFSTFYYNHILQIVYGCLGALFYSLFLAIDTQLVMGRQKYALNPEEYIFASLIIYMDIILIFLYLLILLGGSSR